MYLPATDYDRNRSEHHEAVYLWRDGDRCLSGSLYWLGERFKPDGDNKVMTFTIDSTTHISPNHSSRKNPVPSAIVIHSSEGASAATDLAWLKKPQGEKSVSCHYYVTRTGTIYQLVPDWREAWHAGISEYLGLVGWGDFSIGVECEHRRGQNWTEVQREALAWLCKLLIAKYKIRQPMIAAHRWIAPGRKSDPTDWSDAGLRAWIAELYTPDYQSEWGDKAIYIEHFGIPTRYREEYDAGRPLGKALTHEEPFDHGVVQRFERGLATWNPHDGVVVYRRQA